MKIPTYCFHPNGKQLKLNLKFFSFIALFLFITSSYAQQLAFPEAKGFGKNAAGGRGGVVYKVTNLNDDGVGSFRAALEASGPRTVIFEVSGTIFLEGPITLRNDNITIAGQTAPGDGIAIANYQFTIQASDVIIRHIRFRLGDNGYKDANGNVVGPDTGNSDTVHISGGNGNISNIILDHCSISWSIDESISFYAGSGGDQKNISNVTLQNNLISEPLNCSHHADGCHAMSSLVNSVAPSFSTGITYFKNYFAHARERHIRIQGGGQEVEFVNNLIYDWSYATEAGWGSDLTAVNNYYKKGAQNIAAVALYRYISAGNQGASLADGRAYISGNVTDGGIGEMNSSMAGENESTWFMTSGLQNEVVPISTMIPDVLTNVGATLPKRDPVDLRVIADYNNNTGNLIDTQEQVGGYPTLNSIAPPTDTDDDGMPDAWEITRGLDINDAEDRNIVNGDGYTNLEHYINGIASNGIETVDVTGVTVSPQTATINIPETVTMTSSIEPSNASNQSGVWSSSDPSIATVANNGIVTPLSAGVVVITFNSNDGGFSDSGTITVTDNPIDVESVSLSPETLDLNINVTATLSATILPSNATDITGVWSSSNPNVAVVDQQGNIQPIAIGETTITFTTNNGSLSDTSVITVNDDLFGRYELYNADSDTFIELLEGGEILNIDNIGENINFRVIPFGGDNNPDVESVAIEWTGIDTGSHAESFPLYAGMTGHTGNDYLPYTVQEGVYTYTVRYYSEDSAAGDIVATDIFEVNFTRGAFVQASSDSSICLGDTAALSASGADSYLWSTGEATQTIAVTPDVTTTYTVTGTHAGGTTTTDSVTVTVDEMPVISIEEDQTICAGDSVTLTATTSAGSIVWSTGETTSSITVSPSDTSTYTVTANNNGCSSTDEITINVLEGPNASAGSDVTIPLGDSVTLTATGGGTYEWSTGETTQSITVSPTSNTTYNVVVTNSNNCSANANVTVSIVGAVTANAGQDVAICEGESVTLTASGGDTYQWNTGETTENITVNPLNTTTYSVVVSNQFSSDTDDVIVTVNPIPEVNAGDDVTINQGENVTLYGSGGNTYLWSTGETNTNISVSPSETTTYTVTTTINGCSDTDEVTVTVVQLVQASAGDDQTICGGTEVVLSATGGDSYEWSTGETTQSITVNPSSTTTYSVIATNAYGSDNDEVLVEVEECASLDFEFKAYPNPTDGVINVKISGLESSAVIQVTDILGKQLKYIEIQPNSGQTITTQVNLTGMPKGFYMMTLYGDNRTVTKKMVLK